MKLKRFLMASALALSFVVTAPASAKADPLTAAVVAFAGFTGTAAAVATFVVNTALYAAGSWAIGKASQALGLNKQVAQERQASVTSLSLGEVPRELLIGVACTGGSLIDAFNFGGQYGTDTTTRCIALCDHAVDSIVGYYVDDEYYAWTGDGIQPGFSNALSIEFKNAQSDGWDAPLHARDNGGWTLADRLVGITHVWVDTRFNDKVWTRGHPTLKFVLRGLRCYDPRKDAGLGYTGAEPHAWDNPATHEFSSNAAVVRYNIQRGVYVTGRHGQPQHLLFGRGLSAEEARPERVIAHANVCDEMVDGQRRYIVGGVISAAQSFIEVEQMFAAAMAGEIVQREGGVEVEPGQAKAAVVTITDADIVVGAKRTFSDFLPDTEGGRINTVLPRFVSPEQGWKDHAAGILRDQADIDADGGPRETTLPLMLVTNAAQSIRCGEIARRMARLEKRATITLSPMLAAGRASAELEEGDWIAWQSDRYHGGATVRYRIETFSLGEDWRNTVSLREIASSVFGQSDPVEDLADPPPAPTPIDALDLDGVYAEAITLPGATAIMPALRFTWDVPVDAGLLSIRAEVRAIGGADIAPTRIDDVSSGVAVITNGVGADQALEGRLVPIGDPSRPVLPTAWFTFSTAPLVASSAAFTSFPDGTTPIYTFPTSDDLPVPPIGEGKTAYVEDEGALYIWNGTDWQRPGSGTPDPGTIDRLSFAAGLQPVGLGPTLPALPNPSWPEGSMFVNTTDDKTYRVAGGVWSAKLATVDLTGTITNAQIDALAAAKLTGQITATQISDGSISTPKLAAFAVVAGNIAAGAIVAEKISAGAITVSKLSVVPFNINPDPLFADASFWFNNGFTNNSPGWYVEDGAQLTSIGLNRYCVLWSGNGAVGMGRKHLYSAPLIRPAVTPRKAYRFRGAVKNASNQYAVCGVQFYKGSTYVSGIFCFPPPGSAAQYWEEQGVAPDDFDRAFFVCYNDAPGTTFDGLISASDMQLIEAAGANMIVNGAINSDKLAANSVVAGKIAAGAVTAGAIVAEAIQSKHLSISARGENLVVNGTGFDGLEGWADLAETVGGGSVALHAYVGWFGTGRWGFTFEKTAAGVGGGYVNKAFKATPNRTYSVKFTLGANTASASGLYIRMFHRAAQPSNGFASGLGSSYNDLVSNGPVPSGPQTYELTYTAPSDANWVSFGIYNYVGGPIYLYFSDVEIQEQITAVTISDQGVTANKIAANAVTADKIVAGAVTAAKINVTTLAAINANLGAVTAGSLNIAAGGVVASSGGSGTDRLVLANGKLQAINAANIVVVELGIGIG